MTDGEVEPLPVEPLGVFAPRRSEPWLAAPEVLRSMVGGLADELKGPVASYLRQGNGIVPLMSYTRDVLEDRFGVSGGSALLSDGTYYWREDAANYVEEYGITIPERALQHMRAQHWKPPVLGEDTEFRIHRYLWDELRAHGEDGTPTSGITVFHPRPRPR